MLFPVIVLCCLISMVLITLRLFLILPHSRLHRIHRPLRGQDKARLLVVLGSGGHTAEMLAMLRDLDTSKYGHRTYVISSGDSFSIGKAQAFERSLEENITKSRQASTGIAAGRTSEVHTAGSYNIAVVPRARKIYQSLLTTPFTSLQCLLSCFLVLRGTDASFATGRKAQYPDLIMTNGPATSVIVVLAAIILRFCAVGGTRHKMQSIYVESWARVRRLSLSGKILLYLADRFLVQWESLLPATQGRGEYLGALV